jgi:predicted amidohydrolase YtcJ
MPLPNADEIRDYLRQTLIDMVRWGITTICDMATRPWVFQAYQELLERSELPLRAAIYLVSHEVLGLNPAQSLVELCIRRGFGNDRLKLAGVKFFMDGSPSGRTAAYYEPYAGEPENRGMLYTFMGSDEFHKWVKTAHREQLQVAVHAIGDRAIDETLNVYEEALEENPMPDHRHRIEHCEMCTPKQLQRIKKLGVIPVSNMGFIGLGGDFYSNTFGDRAKWIHTVRSYVDSDIISPSGSDGPLVMHYNPFLQIHSAVTRKTETGKVLNPSQRISREEAIRMMTINGAYAIFEEDRRGSIEPGKLADLIVLSENPFTVLDDELKNIEVLMTIVGGKKIYSKQA